MNTKANSQPAKHSCLNKVPIFNKLSSPEAVELASIIRPAKYQKGEIVQLAGDTHRKLLVLNKGSAKIARTSPDGREQILRLLEAGDFTGELAVFTNQPAGNDIIALEDSTFCTIDGQALTKLMSANSGLVLTFVKELSHRLEDSEQKIESIGLLTAEQRLAEALLNLAAGRREFTLPVSKKDLAAQIGMAPETLSRRLAQWERTGAIKLQGQRGVKITSATYLQKK